MRRHSTRNHRKRIREIQSSCLHLASASIGRRRHPSGRKRWLLDHSGALSAPSRLSAYCLQLTFRLTLTRSVVTDLAAATVRAAIVATAFTAATELDALPTARDTISLTATTTARAADGARAVALAVRRKDSVARRSAVGANRANARRVVLVIEVHELRSSKAIPKFAHCVSRAARFADRAAGVWLAWLGMLNLAG